MLPLGELNEGKQGGRGTDREKCVRTGRNGRVGVMKKGTKKAINFVSTKMVGEACLNKRCSSEAESVGKASVRRKGMRGQEKKTMIIKREKRKGVKKRSIPEK